MRPYIGVTGFTTRGEVEAVTSMYPGGNYDPWFMAGILVSSKTLRGEKNRFPHRYPRREAIRDMLCYDADDRVKFFIHYNSDGGEGLLFELLAMAYLFQTQSRLAGFQLNLCWPSPKVLRRFTKLTKGRYSIILQVGSRALSMTPTGAHLVNKLGEYGDTIDHVLLDPSGGRGIDAVHKVGDQLHVVHCSSPRFGLGIAGGLSPETLRNIFPILRMYPETSVDAEGRLRSDDDVLNVERAVLYSIGALQMYREAQQPVPYRA